MAAVPNLREVSDENLKPARTRTINVRWSAGMRASIGLMAVLASVVFLHWAQAVFIPIALSVMLSYALTPVVNWLRKKMGLHKAVGAALTLIVLAGLLGIGIVSLRPQALEILDNIPRATQKLSEGLRVNPKKSESAVAKIQKAATEIENVANAAATVPAASGVKPKPSADTPPFKIRDYILVGTVGLATGIGQLIVVVSLVYFLLIAGDTFRRTLVRISEGSLSKKKITIQMLDEIDSQVQRYLFVQFATSALLGVVLALVFALIGLEHAAFWGCVGAALHMVPYAGPAVFVALVGLVAYVQFDSLHPVVIVIGSTVLCNSLVGLLLVPWLTQKVGSLNAVTVFVALLFWGWLWGVWGLLLGVPIMMAIQAICARVEALQPFSAFLGHPPKKVPLTIAQDAVAT